MDLCSYPAKQPDWGDTQLGNIRKPNTTIRLSPEVAAACRQRGEATPLGQVISETLATEIAPDH